MSNHRKRVKVNPENPENPENPDHSGNTQTSTRITDLMVSCFFGYLVELGHDQFYAEVVQLIYYIVPSQGVGGNGIASEFGDLTGMSRQEVDQFLLSLGATVKIRSGGYTDYKFTDGSRISIRPDGEVVRTPAPKYGPDGTRINRGLRLDRDGGLLKTKDAFGNLILDTHSTGEQVRD